MSLSTRLDKLEAAMLSRDGDPPDETWLGYRLSDWAEGCPVARPRGGGTLDGCHKPPRAAP
jgi:hypothetical protein